eukprot:gene2531-2899_t
MQSNDVEVFRAHNQFNSKIGPILKKRVKIFALRPPFSERRQSLDAARQAHLYKLSIPLKFMSFASAAAAVGYNGWTLDWSDEFNGNKVNLNNWRVINYAPEVNQELEFYSKNNVYVENGSLVLVSKKQKLNGRNYTSGKVESKATTLFGRIEASIKLPSGQALSYHINKYLWTMSIIVKDTFMEDLLDFV